MSNPTLQMAVQQHKAGRLADAEALYRQVLTAHPDEPTALHLLGVLLAASSDQSAVAIELIRRAITVKPDYVHAHYNLAELLRKAGQFPEAISSYQQAIALNRNFAEAHFGLGQAMEATRNSDEAIKYYRRAIVLRPAYPEAYCNLGGILTDVGKPQEGLAACMQALAINAGYAEAHNAAGIALAKLDRREDAIGSYERALALKPNYPEAFNNLGIALAHADKLEEAIASYHRALELKPDDPEICANLSVAQLRHGQLKEAFNSYERALTLSPAGASARVVLGGALNNLGNVFKDIGQVDEAIAAYRRALTFKPESLIIHSNLLFTLQFDPRHTPAEIYAEHRRWNEERAAGLSRHIEPHRNDRNPGRRLRIGYVSPDFRAHSVSYFFEPILTGHDPANVEVFCYSANPKVDAVTTRLQKLGHSWRAIYDLSDQQAAALVREDQIDILVDLTVHTGNNRLLLFARKPAPIQVTYLGYAGTTGLSVMDYRITDGLVDPPGLTDAFHTERLVRLPRTQWCFQSPPESPPVGKTPCLSSGFITFGSGNTLAKMTPEVIALWARVLHAVPGSRLLIKSWNLGQPPVQRRVADLFDQHGIVRERLGFEGPGPTVEFLDFFNKVDIILDTFPFNGGTISCLALWMGVPVVTMAQDRSVSRVGASILTNVGLPELIADTPEQYFTVAIGLAQNSERLEGLRQGMRKRLQASALMDQTGFVRDLEAAYRQMWRRWCTDATVTPV